MKFAYAIIYVESVSETVEFYQKAFGFTKKFVTPERDYGELISGETTLSFGSNELRKSNF
ncbi:MAG: VOC family protein [Bacteroidota bacterium]